MKERRNGLVLVGKGLTGGGSVEIDFRDDALYARDPADRRAIMHGASYSYSEPRLSRALRLGGTSVRDFIDIPEELLQFK